MAKKPHSDAPSERSATVRTALRQALRERPLTARDLSARIGVSEKQIPDHLDHVARSLKRTAERLHVEPACCLECGFTFRKRDRLSKPSSCPLCRSQHLESPRFAILPT